MLPEKKKNLIIFISAITLVIVIGIIVAIISNVVKSKREESLNRRNDPYPNTYNYFGVTIDKDLVYHIYGITNDFKEEDTAIKSFYTITDIKNINNKVKLFADAINEIRYDRKKREYYLYIIDDFYQKNGNVVFINDYIAYYKDGLIYNHKIGTDRIEDGIIADSYITTDLGVQSIAYDNIFYYLDDSGIETYNPNTNTKYTLLENTGKNIVMYGTDSNYLIYTEDNVLKIIGLAGKMVINLNDVFKNFRDQTARFIGYVNNELLIETKDDAGNTELKKYTISNNAIGDFNINLDGFSIINSYNIDGKYYYLDLKNNLDKEKHLVIDIINSNIVKELDNSYINFVGVR